MPQRVLIVDDDRDLSAVLARRCAGMGLDVLTAHDTPEALSIIETAHPDVICLDVTLPSGDGISLCETLAADSNLCKTPVIILTGRSDEDIVRRCHALCAYYVPKCAEVWPRVAPLLQELLGWQSDLPASSAALRPAEPSKGTLRTPVPDGKAHHGPQRNARPLATADAIVEMLAKDRAEAEPAEAEPSNPVARDPSSPPWILHIEDDLEFSRALQIRLEQHGVAVVRAEDGMEGYRSAFAYPADAILLDYSMPNGQGDYVLRRLKENPVTKDIPVIVLTGNSHRALERKMLSIGAAKFLAKPLDFDELVETLSHYMDVLPRASISCPS